MKETTTKKDINNSCTNELDLQLISQIKKRCFLLPTVQQNDKRRRVQKVQILPKGGERMKLPTIKKSEYVQIWENTRDLPNKERAQTIKKYLEEHKGEEKEVERKKIYSFVLLPHSSFEELLNIYVVSAKDNGIITYRFFKGSKCTHKTACAKYIIEN